MKRKLVAILLAVFCCLFAFSGCGDSKDAENGNDQYYKNGEVPETETETLDRYDPKYYDEDGNYIGGYEEETEDTSKYYDEDGNYIGK